MNELLETPNGIGPHEGMELELMLKGEKPMAMFSDTIPSSMELPEEKFLPFVQSGKIIKVEKVYQPPSLKNIKIRNVYYALTGEEWRIDRLHEINKNALCREEPITDNDEKETGYLLGYSPEQVSCFLKWKHETS